MPVLSTPGDTYLEIYPRKSQIWQTTGSWFSQTEKPNAIVDYWGFPLGATIHWSHSSLCIPTVHFIVNSRQTTSIWIYLHSITCCFLYLLPVVVQTIFKCESWDILVVAALAASWWTNWCLLCCWVPPSAVIEEASIISLDLDLLSADWGVHVGMIRCCGIGEEDNNKE